MVSERLNVEIQAMCRSVMFLILYFSPSVFSTCVVLLLRGFSSQVSPSFLSLICPKIKEILHLCHKLECFQSQRWKKEKKKILVCNMHILACQNDSEALGMNTYFPI